MRHLTSAFQVAHVTNSDDPLPVCAVILGYLASSVLY